ncbi:class I SAM-dependent methyltransferase [Gephyromycinifex aptenodytis]|uniref:class I SAM-dependent methyltransferase n=1 Tax=Gephyromycinifex aptenodytis TaxID=2716227 RepID=UPI0014477D5D|nr:class I SAM-dependent methyltransferase [Gephyromycinifex aptenodytis]
MDLATVQQLTCTRGAALLAAMPPYDEATALSLGSGLREGGYSPEIVAAVLTQTRLRAKAEAKFGEFARGMLFTPDGLEQATRFPVAARHAQRFREAGIEHVFDLGCGIGADAMAFASLGLQVTAVEIDEATAAIAAHNLRHFDAHVICAPAQEVDIPDGAGVWLDPARRNPGRTDATGRTQRVFRLDALSPSWDAVQQIAQRCPTGAKLAPGFPRAQVPPGTEAVWTAVDGDVLECTIWWGALARTPGRTALVLRQGQALSIYERDLPEQPAHPVPVQAGGWLYEPDLALLQAGLVGALEAAVEGAELSPGVGYVFSQQCLEVPYARRYRVLEVLAAQPKPVRAALRSAGVGRITLKRRGGRISPEDFRQSLRLSGEGQEATLVLTLVGTRARVLLVEPA